MTEPDDVLELAARSASREAKTAALDARRILFEREVKPIVRQMRDLALEGRTLDVLRLAGAFCDEIKALHIAAYVAGRSGKWSAMTADEYRAVSARVARQYDYALRWAGDLAATPADDMPSVAALEARAMLYAAAATASFEAGMAADVGLDAARLPALPGDGSTECRVRCRCRWAIRVLSKSRGDYDVSWRMQSGESCRTCRRRAIAWKRLRVRSGVMVDAVELVVASR